MASRRQAFEYTILLGGTTTVNMITDEGGFRIGDWSDDLLFYY